MKEATDKDLPLKEDIRLLGRLLGDTLCACDEGVGDLGVPAAGDDRKAQPCGVGELQVGQLRWGQWQARDLQIRLRAKSK